MPKLYRPLICDRIKSKIACNLCGKKYDGKRGIKLHFKYSHRIILTGEDINENGEIVYRCLSCTKNGLNCSCPVDRYIVS